MKMEPLKHDNQVPVGAKLIKADTVFEGGSCKRVTMYFDNGKVLEAAYGQYAMDVRVMAAPKMVKYYKVTATLFGAKIVKVFAAIRDAEAFRNKLNDSGAEGDKLETVKFEEGSVELSDDEQGAVRLIGQSDEIPF